MSSPGYDVHLAKWWRPDLSSARGLGTGLPGGHLAIARDGHVIEILQLNPRPGVILRLLGTRPHASGLRRIHPLPNRPFKGKYILTTGHDGYISLWSLDLQRIVTEVDGGGGPIYGSVVLDEPGKLPTILTACANGTVRQYKLTSTSDIQPDDDDAQPSSALLESPEIVLHRIVLKTPKEAKCLSLAASAKYIFVGTHDGSLLVFNWETNRIEYTVSMASPQRSRKRRKVKKDISEEETMPEGANVFAYLEEKDKKAQQEAEAEEAARQEASVHNMALLYIEDTDGLGSVIMGDNFGRVIVVDSTTFTICQELTPHKGPVTDFTLLDSEGGAKTFCSVGGDGRIVLFHLEGADWVPTVTRYAHLADCTAVVCVSSLADAPVIVSGDDGSIAVYERGEASLTDLTQMPRRVHHTHILGHRRWSPRASGNSRFLASVSPQKNSVTLWTYLREPGDPNRISQILTEARKRLKMKQTRSLNQFVTAKTLEAGDDLWQQVGESQWVARKFGEIEFRKERVYDAVWVSSGNQVWVLTNKGIRVVDVDYDKVEMKETKFKTRYPEIAGALASSKRTITGLESAPDMDSGRIFITTADRSSKRAGSFKFSVFIVRPDSDSVEQKYSGLGVAPFYLVIGKSHFASMNVDGSVVIYSSSADASKTSRAGITVPRLVDLEDTSKGVMKNQIFPASDAFMTFSTDDEYLVAMAYPNYYAAFRVEDGKFATFADGHQFAQPTISNIWSESNACLVIRAFVALRKESGIIETYAITRRNRIVVEMRVADEASTTVSFRDAERLSSNMEPDQICLGAVVLPNSEAWKEMSNEPGSNQLLAFTVHRDTLEGSSDAQPFVRRIYGAG